MTLARRKAEYMRIYWNIQLRNAGILPGSDCNHLNGKHLRLLMKSGFTLREVFNIYNRFARARDMRGGNAA